MFANFSKTLLTCLVAAGLMLVATASSDADVIVTYFDGSGESLAPVGAVSFVTADTATINHNGWSTSWGSAGDLPAGPVAGSSSASTWLGLKGATETASSTSRYGGFKITYTGSDQLNLDTLRFNWTAARAVTSGAVNFDVGWTVFVSVNSAAFTPIDSLALSPINYTAPGFSAGNGGIPEVATETVDLSSLAALSNGDTIELRVAMADNTGATNFSTFIQGLELNGIEGTETVPEPASALLFVGGACLMMGSRRKNKNANSSK